MWRLSHHRGESHDKPEKRDRLVPSESHCLPSEHTQLRFSSLSISISVASLSNFWTPSLAHTRLKGACYFLPSISVICDIANSINQHSIHGIESEPCPTQLRSSVYLPLLNVVNAILSNLANLLQKQLWSPPLPKRALVLLRCAIVEHRRDALNFPRL